MILLGEPVSESSIRSDFERISKVLAILYDNPEYAPFNLSKDYGNDFNPTNDGIKTRILKIERAWDWRERIFHSFRCTLPACCHQMDSIRNGTAMLDDFCHRVEREHSNGWIPFERHHCFAWWSYYCDGVYHGRSLDGAIWIISRNFDRWRVWVEDDE